MRDRLFALARVLRNPRSTAWWIGCLAALAGLFLAGDAVHATSLAAPDAPLAPIATTAEDWKLPGTQPNGLTDALASSQTCTFCHVDHITTNYAGSMMANSARDPIFRAALAVANQDAVNGGETCIRCHVPGAWLNGRSTPTDGSAFNAQDMEGVTCTVCHRMLHGYAISGEATEDAAERAYIKGLQGTQMEGSSAFILDRKDIRRGPYSYGPPPAPPHGWSQSSYLRSAELCANCHEIDNPILTYNDVSGEFELNPLNQAASLADRLFPIERTYSEWKFSDFNPDNGGVTELSSRYPGIKRATLTEDGPVTVCQDCHMPAITSPIATGGIDRIVGKHEWAGGSALWQAGISSFWDFVLGDPSFNNTATLDARAKGQAQLEKAADLELARSGNQLTVKITNQTGHKLPTGYAEGRRMWLQVIARAQDDALLYSSGVPLNGKIVNPTKVYEIKLGVTQSHAQTINRPDIVAGETFHFILNNRVVKDNRIPPRGFSNAIAETRTMQPVGYSYADGQYWDATVYTLPVGTTKVEVTLFFQIASGEYLDFLEEKADVLVADGVVGTPVNWGKQVGSLRDIYQLDEPVVMASATLNIPAPGIQNLIFLPLIEQ